MEWNGIKPNQIKPNERKMSEFMDFLIEISYPPTPHLGPENCRIRKRGKIGGGVGVK